MDIQLVVNCPRCTGGRINKKIVYKTCIPFGPRFFTFVFFSVEAQKWQEIRNHVRPVRDEVLPKRVTGKFPQYL